MHNYLIFLLLILGCSKVQSQPNFPVGEVVDSVICLKQPVQTYAVYTPSYYSEEKAWPIIYIFEPGARGVLPVNIFKRAAEKWGYIVVGSNNSKNGHWDVVFEAANAMFDDTHKRFNVDKNRIYTSGFSGGARAAIAIAALTKKIRGVIGCGAGSSNSIEHQLNVENKVPYVGVIGDIDMNYLEVKKQEKTFNNIGIKNIRLVWPSIHQWPPSHMIDKAIQWMEYQTNDTLSVERRSLIEKNFMSYRDSLYENSQEREGTRIAKYLKRDMNIEPEHHMISYEDSKEFKKESKIIAKNDKKEESFREMYFKEAAKIPQTRLNKIDSVNPIRWWKTEVNRWQKKKNSKDVNVQKMSLRLLNHIWASFAEQSFNYERAQDYELALRLNEIWLYGQPTSVWPLWSRAKLYALNKDKEGALEYLERAYDNGMSRIQSITQQDAFKILQEEARYKQLVSKLSQ